MIQEWKSTALEILDSAKAEIEKSDEPIVVVICTIAQADILKERPVSIYHNQTHEWTHRLFAFMAWRTSLWESNSAIAARGEQVQS